jgi:hypothetical protein
MTDIVLWMYAICIAIFFSGMVIVPLVGLCWHVMKIKMNEIKDGMG